MGSACLVQQLFRQKVGKELDRGLIDEVLFPMLRSRKDYPRELLLDIKFTSGIFIARLAPVAIAHAVMDNVKTFTRIPEHWKFEERVEGIEATLRHREKLAAKYHSRKNIPGYRSSKVRRKNIRGYGWGAIDILNELRKLDYPQIGYRPSGAYEEKANFPGDEFDDAYIRLEEDNSLPPDWSEAQRCRNRIAIEGRTRFVNNFTKDALVSGKRLNWEGAGYVIGWEPCRLPLNPPFQYLCRQVLE